MRNLPVSETRCSRRAPAPSPGFPSRPIGSERRSPPETTTATGSATWPWASRPDDQRVGRGWLRPRGLRLATGSDRYRRRGAQPGHERRSWGGRVVDRFGFALATIDLNCDGFDDLAIGAPFENVGSVQNAGAFWVLFGGPSGLTGNGAVDFDGNDWPQDQGAETDDELGRSLIGVSNGSTGNPVRKIGESRRCPGLLWQRCGGVDRRRPIVVAGRRCRGSPRGARRLRNQPCGWRFRWGWQQ